MRRRIAGVSISARACSCPAICPVCLCARLPFGRRARLSCACGRCSCVVCVAGCYRRARVAPAWCVAMLSGIGRGAGRSSARLFGAACHVWAGAARSFCRSSRRRFLARKAPTKKPHKMAPQKRGFPAGRGFGARVALLALSGSIPPYSPPRFAKLPKNPPQTLGKKISPAPLKGGMGNGFRGLDAQKIRR